MGTAVATRRRARGSRAARGLGWVGGGRCCPRGERLLRASSGSAVARASAAGDGPPAPPRGGTRLAQPAPRGRGIPKGFDSPPPPNTSRRMTGIYVQREHPRTPALGELI